MTTERGSRGKYAEKEVVKVFKKWNASAAFAWHRLPDARSARGALAAQPADFIVSSGDTVFLEVKETEHKFRLAKDKVAQLPTLHKFKLAGTDFCVLIYHTASEVWRVVPSDAFSESAPSWDLSGYPTFANAEAALEFIFDI